MRENSVMIYMYTLVYGYEYCAPQMYFIYNYNF